MKPQENITIESEKINDNPLTLVYTLFNTVKYKTGCIGLWKDKNGTIHKDNIKLSRFFIMNLDLFKYCKKQLFQNGELAVFYKDKNNHGIIENKEGNKQILKHQILIKEKHLKYSYIKELLKQHNGLTIYRVDNEYLIEIYKGSK